MNSYCVWTVILIQASATAVNKIQTNARCVNMEAQGNGTFAQCDKDIEYTKKM
jgi:hypothetical protein